ncbi:hypothetical protein C482_15346 [Natrialba chahannaoensis JCM 10990]|uniref:Uncharacterized protein n=1 Tax=Natrialba chahannaoensis JCM 10990 TaxID=1227492 RepID=M0AFV7_9EURY|nr:hypothetical protein [Natrialba chahannaoensis]ELY96762.1 hypothetical protein C482_15346 [Natrialba chahannaoensis JCM 10990]
MTEVNWVLDQLGSVVDDIANSYTNRNDNPVALKRVNRDDSSVYDGSGDLDLNEPMHKRTDSLEKGVYVGATLADRATSPRGTEYDHEIETVVAVTVEGMTSQGGHYGHVDPDGENGIPFDDLVRQIRRTLLGMRSYPETDIPHTTYHDLLVTNDDPQSAEYRDFYRYQFDCTLRGCEKLPEL